jgi:hypothetical protein
MHAEMVASAGLRRPIAMEAGIMVQRIETNAPRSKRIAERARNPPRRLAGITPSALFSAVSIDVARSPK